MKEKKKVSIGARKSITIIFIIILLVATVVGIVILKQNFDEENRKSKEQLSSSDEKIKELESNQSILINSISSEINDDNNNSVNNNSINNMVNTENTTVSSNLDLTDTITDNTNNTTNNMKQYTFITPVGEGVFEVYADYAVQLSGFTGASAHIYYLKGSDLYYHFDSEDDVKLASEVKEITVDREGKIIVNAGANYKVYEENQYVEYNVVD